MICFFELYCMVDTYFVAWLAYSGAKVSSGPSLRQIAK